MPEPAYKYFESDNAPTVNQEKPKFSIFRRADSSTQAELFSTKDDQVQALLPRFREDIEFDATSTANQQNRKLSVFRRDDPFTQTELLSTRDDQVQALIHQIRKYHENLANQLITLFNFAKEERSTSLGISMGSLGNFFDFLQLYITTKNPTLSLTPDYDIYASWRAEDRIFSVHFLQNGDIRFVLFKPNSRQPKRKIRVTGIATSDTLTEIVPRESLIHWVFDER